MNNLFFSKWGVFSLSFTLCFGLLLITKVNAEPSATEELDRQFSNDFTIEQDWEQKLLTQKGLGDAEDLSGIEIITPLQKRHPRFPTAQQLEQGEVTFQFYNRQFFDQTETDGTESYPSLGVSWGITDNTELAFTYHRLNTGGLWRQGEFGATRNSRSDTAFLESQEVTLEVKQRLWENESETEAISVVVSASIGDRSFRFSGGGIPVEEGLRQGVVPAIQVPYTNTLSDGRLQLTVAPTLAFFDQENALHLHQTPSDDPDEFGTSFGVAGAASYLVSSRLMLWGDVFAPFTGNNSIARETGEAGKTLVYNAGLRYMANPRMAVDLFASNSLGRTGPLTLTGDRELVAVGAGVEFLPSFVGASRRHPETFTDVEEMPSAEAGFAFYDGGIIDSGEFLVNLRGGSQGILSSLRFSPVRDLELGIYLDSVSGTIDESEQGISAKVRLLDQAKGDPFTGSFAATVGITNQPFTNFDNNNRNEFEARNLSKETPFVLEVDDRSEGKLYVATLSLPLHYRFENGSAAWATPTLAYVQRNGIQIAGLNVGGSAPINEAIDIIGEVGANFTDEGNAFVANGGEKRGNALAYSLGLRWQPEKLLGMNFEEATHSPELEFYLTNRVGSSTFHNLRVRDQNNLAVGVGLSIPFR